VTVVIVDDEPSLQRTVDHSGPPDQVSKPPLLDHTIGPNAYCIRNRNTDGLGSSDVEDQLEVRATVPQATQPAPEHRVGCGRYVVPHRGTILSSLLRELRKLGRASSLSACVLDVAALKDHQRPQCSYRTAISRHCRRHSIISSARSRSDCGMVRPIAFPALRLMTSSNFAGCSTGRSAGLAPLRILST